MSLAKSHHVETSARARRGSASGRITIGDMARAFNVSLRTLRFYEDRGLLVPQREGTTRYYAPRDKERLELVLQGKQLGFTLTEIREMLADADKRPQAKRLALKPEQITSQIQHLERQRADIDGAIAELRNVQRVLQDVR